MSSFYDNNLNKLLALKSTGGYSCIDLYNDSFKRRQYEIAEMKNIITMETEDRNSCP